MKSLQARRDRRDHRYDATVLGALELTGGPMHALDLWPAFVRSSGLLYASLLRLERRGLVVRIDGPRVSYTIPRHLKAVS